VKVECSSREPSPGPVARDPLRMPCSTDRGPARPVAQPSLLSMRGGTPLPLKKLDQLDRMFTEKIQTVKSSCRARTRVSKILACVAILRPAHAVCGQLPYELDPDICSCARTMRHT
jgi:hypothetical protein